MHFDFSPAALKELYKLPLNVQERIGNKIMWYASQPQPLLFAKALSGTLAGYFRFRVGMYRIICLPDGSILYITRIAKRSRTY